MTSTASGHPAGSVSARKGARLSLVVLVVLGVYNVLLNLVLPAWTHVGLSVVVAFGLVLLARASGLSWFDVGFARCRLRGLRWGLIVAATIATALAVLTAIPASRDVLDDPRFVGVSVWTGARKAFIEIPLTVGFEEVAFRGVLLGTLLRVTSVVRAVLYSAVIFGLWHVLPTLELLETERDLPLDSTPLALLGTLAGTAVAGFAFAWLRLADRSIVSPYLAHATLNSVGYVLGWSIVRWQL